MEKKTISVETRCEGARALRYRCRGVQLVWNAFLKMSFKSLFY